MAKVSSARKPAGILTISILLLLALFHGGVLLKAIPGDFVWGGGAGVPDGNLQTMEAAALAVSLIFAFLAAGRSGILPWRKPAWLFSAGSWVMAAYFLFNTLGNLLSPSSVEKAAFLPVSIILFSLSLFLGLRGGAD